MRCPGYHTFLVCSVYVFFLPFFGLAQKGIVHGYKDTLGHTVYCVPRLLADDTAYEKRVNVVYPALEVLGHSVVTWGITRFALNAGYSRISFKTWSRNIRMGWEWDKDPIQSNFIGHPYSGALSHAAARASGYNFYRAFPFAVAGSLLWEYFGENERPSYNDVISTPVAGAYWGEVMHHISSNVLDDRSVGAERVFREVFAGLIDPVRGFDRLVRGKTARRAQCEVYQKEPIDVGIASGLHLVNDGMQFGTGHANALVSVQVVYGDPFEIRKRKPFDFFSFRADLSYGPSRKPLDNINGKGLVAGANLGNRDDNRVFIGAFEHFDYWNNEFFAMSALGLGGDLVTRARLAANTWFYNSFSVAAVPLSGIGSRLGVTPPIRATTAMQPAWSLNWKAGSSSATNAV